MKIIVNEENITTRLDQLLINYYPNFSRNQLSHLIKSGNCLVNDKVELKPSYHPKHGDVVESNFEEVKQERTIIKPQEIKLDVIYEDDDLLVIDKPIGILVHPGSGNYDNTIANALAFLGSKLSNKENNYGLVHRLDKETSGVLLTAKNLNSLSYYSSKFENREVTKEYYCVVDKGIEKAFKDKETIEIKGYIGRSHTDRKKMMLSPEEFSNSRYSETQFKLYMVKDNYALLKAYPKTGRTHQIRVHLKYYGYPILGDTIYKGKTFERLMLHAKSLQIIKINGELATFTTKTPDIFCSLFGKSV